MVCHKIGEGLNLDSSAIVSTQKEIQTQPKSNHLNPAAASNFSWLCVNNN